MSKPRLRDYPLTATRWLIIDRLWKIRSQRIRNLLGWRISMLPGGTPVWFLYPYEDGIWYPGRLLKDRKDIESTWCAKVEALVHQKPIIKGKIYIVSYNRIFLRFLPMTLGRKPFTIHK